MNRLIAGVSLSLTIATFTTLSAAQGSIGWSLKGSRAWQNRLGPGLTLAIGGNDCTDDYCDDQIDTRLAGSFGISAGFYYRLYPNLVLFADLHVAYMNTDYALIRDDKGLLFQIIGGVEFHAPFTGWFEAYAGLGFGYALLRSHGPTVQEGIERVESLRGVDFELKIGLDVYLFSGLPTLGLGPLFKLGFAVWPTACVEVDGSKECHSPDVISTRDEDDMPHVDETPFLIFIGLAARYGF